jgi:hypothetical protein
MNSLALRGAAKYVTVRRTAAPYNETA